MASMMPPQLSSVTETIRPTHRPPSVPRRFWERRLKPIFLVNPNGLTFEKLETLFWKENGYRMSMRLFGYETTESLAKDIDELCVSCGKVFYDWGHNCEFFH